MNEETFNMQLRKFLKKVGITSQREIEQAVRAAVEAGTVSGNERLSAKMSLSIPAIGLELDIDDEIALD